ncbi:GNAT family N-acetyltransferase [Paenibacillus sp. LMG 31461]|uniref:GNAT family N-acetyltransferase n=1 Tax=Paenibacillus plantarum TaxID=2654975 RepID=A0ABX1XLP6_9BACL|nr:N-acetyltransferase [Paenibacillus plantarum]NOU68783.1 GNAT family N-acetyltransferase [Paenibacillus plantarum]
MITHPVIHMERMKEEHRASVSQLLLQGFCNKIQFGTGLNNAQLQLLLERLLVLDEQRGEGQRIVAMQEESVIGSLSLQFRAHSGIPRPSTTVMDLLPLWKGIQGVGWGKTLGFAVRLACLSHRPARGEMYIADVSVHERFRGSGVGKTMLEWVLREAVTRPGIRYASLYVSGSNVGAKRLYERMGFRTLEVQRSTFMGWLFGEQEWNYMIHEG